MKSTAVFSVSEGYIKFLHVSVGQKKNILALDVIAVDQLKDDQITERLTALVKARRLNFKETSVVVVVSRTVAILRPMTFPTHKDDELQAMIELQVANQIPYAREDVQMDYQVLEKTSDGYSRVLAVIIPQDVVMRYWTIFSKARIPVSRITISSVGLWLLYKMQADISSQLGAVIDMEGAQTEICLCQKDHWLNSREIPIGLNHIQENGLSEFLKQWQLTLESKSAHKIQKPQTAYIVINKGHSPSLLEDISNVLGCRIVEIDLVKIMPGTKNIVWPPDLTGQTQSWAALAGVALSGQLPPINLIPQLVRDEKAFAVRRKEMILCGFWGVCAAVFLALAFAMGFIKNNMQLEALDKILKEHQKNVKKVDLKWQQVKDMESIFKNRLLMSGWISEIYRLLPKSITLVNVTLINGNTLSFQGISAQPSDISQMQNLIANSPIFSNVNLDYVNKRITQEGEVNYFKMTAEIKSSQGEG